MREVRTLAEHGMKLFPCHHPVNGACSCGNPSCDAPAKHPRVKGWQELATSDLEQLRAWWRQWPGTNYGIACGQSAIFVLDVDPRHDGDDTLANLEREHGQPPDTWRFLTGGGGQHIVFRDPGIELDLRNSASKLGRGLDCRGHGGLIIAPGSRHVSGRAYAIDVDHHPDDVALADLPQWIVSLLAQKMYEPRMAAPADDWRELAASEVPEGQRNQTITRISGLLLRR
jgi:putative DNA primase/helicase